MRRMSTALLALGLVAASCGSSGSPTGPAASAPSTTTAAPTTTAPSTTTAAPTTTAPSTTTAAPTTTLPPWTALTLAEDTAPLGALLAAETIGLDWPDAPAVAWRVRYRSVSVMGDPIEVTGLIVAPAEPATSPRPVFSVVHGTTGVADQCAPSLDFPEGWSTELMVPAIADGWVVVATDYEGMGGPGLHPYIVGQSEAQGGFDIVRAAASIPELMATGPLVVWGHSQGGHAAMHSAQRWQQLAPELNLVGVAAGAPPSQLGLLSDFLRGSDFQGYMVMAGAGLATAYPELELADVVNPDYLHLLDELENGCNDHIFETFNGIPYEDLLLVDDIFAEPDWAARLTENDTNQLPVQVPTIILHGDQDEQIPVISSQWLFEQVCAMDGRSTLERIVYEGHDHSSTVDAYWPDLMAWTGDRVAGVEATDGCPA